MARISDIISIIVPVYNVENYMGKCINSIINQDYTNLDIILVNDGSTDHSGIICDKFAMKDNRIKVLHKKNGGLSSARNAGLNISRGSYILFIDSDDWIKQGMITDLYQTICETNADLSVCGITMTDGEKEIPLEWYKTKLKFSTEQALYELISNKKLTSHAWNKLFRKDIIKDILFPEGELYEDIRIMHFIFEKCRSVAVTNQRYYYYNQRQNSITALPVLKNKLALVEAFENRYYELINKYPQYKELMISQIGMSFALVLVQNRFSCSQIDEYKAKLDEELEFLRCDEVNKAIKKYCSKKNYLIYIMAKKLGIKANMIYRVVR